MNTTIKSNSISQLRGGSAYVARRRAADPGIVNTKVLNDQQTPFKGWLQICQETLPEQTFKEIQHTRRKFMSKNGQGRQSSDTNYTDSNHDISIYEQRRKSKNPSSTGIFFSRGSSKRSLVRFGSAVADENTKEWEESL